MKILNLYAGIGGNRKLWGDDHDITAVEYNPEIAAIYQDLYPNDTVIVTDAHQYLLDHYKEYNFIWSSPPCPTHSVTNHFLNPQGVIRYPDMGLWQEIIFLKHFFNGKYCIENVRSYYEPLIYPQIMDRHYFWTNFKIPFVKKQNKISVTNAKGDTRRKWSEHIKELQDYHGINLDKYKQFGKHGHYKVLANCVHPEIGQHILNIAQGIITKQNTNQLELEI